MVLQSNQFVNWVDQLLPTSLLSGFYDKLLCSCRLIMANLKGKSEVLPRKKL